MLQKKIELKGFYFRLSDQFNDAEKAEPPLNIKGLFSQFALIN